MASCEPGLRMRFPTLLSSRPIRPSLSTVARAQALPLAGSEAGSVERGTATTAPPSLCARRTTTVAKSALPPSARHLAWPRHPHHPSRGACPRRWGGAWAGERRLIRAKIEGASASAPALWARVGAGATCMRAPPPAHASHAFTHTHSAHLLQQVHQHRLLGFRVVRHAQRVELRLELGHRQARLGRHGGGCVCVVVCGEGGDACARLFVSERATRVRSEKAKRRFGFRRRKKWRWWRRARAPPLCVTAAW